MFFITLIVLVLGIFSYYFQILSKKDFPPGPFGVPFLGYLPFLNPKKPYETLTKLSQKYGPIYGVQLGSIYCVVLAEASLIRDAFKREEFTGRAPLFVTHGIMGGHGLICAEGELWKNQRKVSIEWLKNMGMVKFGAKREDMEQRIMNGVDSCLKDFGACEEVDPAHILLHHIGNLMNDFVFGLKYEKDDETWKYLQNLQEEGVKLIGVSGAVNFLPALRFLPSNKNVLNFLLTGISKTHKVYNEIITKCKSNLKSIKGDFILKSFLEEKARCEAQNDPSLQFFSDKQFYHLLADMFGAGLDTTMTTVRWFILFVAINEEVRGKIHQELIDFDGFATDKVGLVQINKMHYLKAAVAETQRIRSVVPLGIPHGTTVETEINGYKIPANSMILPVQWAIHMNLKDWPEPEKFNPNRFLNEKGEYRTPSTFMPFQAGRRVCLGDEMAKMILYLFAANFLARFEFEADKDQKLDGVCGITLTPPDFKLKIKINEQYKKFVSINKQQEVISFHL